ncbi:MAG TPA: glycoside hydrolase family 2 TIM barrel-domain containing protein, partial [Isosphaeraceae bacterium]
TMREVVARDKNHPSIITWVAFNETWGLGSPDQYKANKDTQGWVKRMVGEIRKLDPTRLVEDNSPCNYDHVEGSDLNSWHFYIDDHEGAKRHIADVIARTKPGGSWNFCPGEKQSTAPLINSEYGGVSAGGGDRDISWCFRDLTTLLRRQPKIQGYVYTELTDIEWEHNGFFNYDRTPKHYGYEAFIPDMHVNELQGDDFVGYDGPPAIVAKPGQTITVPVFISHYSGRDFEPKLRWWLDGYDDRGDMIMASSTQSVAATWKPYDVTEQPAIRVRVPDRPFVGSLNLSLRDPENHRFAVNYVNIVVRPEKPQPRAEVESAAPNDAVLRFAPEDFAKQSWTRVGSPPAGKAYGFGKGYLEYRIKVPEAVVKAGIETIRLQLEMSSKAERQKVDWAERKSKPDYPQTDERKWPTTLEVSLNGGVVHREEIEDDPADAKGVLSHLARVEHGSYGELVEVQVPPSPAVRAALAEGRPLVIRLAVPDSAEHAGGLCLFGAETGRYPFDPTVTIHTRDPLPAGLGVAPEAPVATEIAKAREIPIVAAGDATRGKPAVWAFTTERPADGWDAPDFDDAAWRRGPGGFGTPETPGIRVRTAWDSPRIWLRTHFDSPAIGQGDVVRLHLFHDEDVEVRLNGTPIFQARGYVTDYLDVALDDAAKALLRPGGNVLAVSCRQSGGGQGVDVGLGLSRAAD